MKLYMVAHGYVLHDPKASGLNKTWLLSGQTLDLDDAWVVREIKGQEYKLVPAAANAVETPRSRWPLVIFNRYTREVPARAAAPTVEHTTTSPASVEPEAPRKSRKKKGDL
jgi:hypothetical protein